MRLFFYILFYTSLLLPNLSRANLSDSQQAAIDAIQIALQSRVSVTPLQNNVEESRKDKGVTPLEKNPSKTNSKKSQKKTVKTPNKKKKRKISFCLGGDYQRLAKRAKKYDKLIRVHSLKYGVSESLIKAIITAESCFNERAESPKGAQGLMQLMPATGKRFGTRDRFNPNTNIKAGTRYLKFLLEYYEEDLLYAIAAYNAGEGAVDKYKGIPPYQETKMYVSKVAALYKLYTQGGGVLSSDVVAATHNKALIQSIFVPRAMPKSRFSPYIGRKRNISRGQCANRTSTRLKKSTKVEGGNGVWQRVYVARHGDTLTRVMQRTGVHKTKIAQMNGLRSRARLREGQRILIWECRK